MKLTDEQFGQLFDKIIKSPEVIGQSEKDNQIWIQGYSFAINQLYDTLVTNGKDEDDKFFEQIKSR